MTAGALQGRRVLVTGASSGIGRAVVEACASAGAHVGCLGRRQVPLEQIAAAVGGTAATADVRDAEQVARAVAAVRDGLGGLDAVVNSAGVIRPGSLRSTDADDWRLMFDTNVIGLLSVTQAALPDLLGAPLADVVNLSSMGGRRVRSVGFGIYSATKFAVHAVSESLRRELHGTGIRVTVLAPGAVDTSFTGAPAASERVGLDPADVARQVVWVLSQPPDVHLHEIAMTSSRQPPV